LDYSVSPAESMAGSIIHMIGFGLNLTTVALLIVFSALKGTTTQIVSFALYGAFLNIYLIFSVLFNSLTAIDAKKVFKILERCSGYLLLIGIFIPVTLIVMGNKGWIYLSIFMLLNIAGMINTAIYGKLKETINAGIHVLTFIFIVLFFVFNYKLFDMMFLLWLGIAFVLFLVGLIFEDLKGIKFHRAYGYFCFLLATICLFFGYFFYLI